MALIDLYNKTKVEENVDHVFIQVGSSYLTFRETASLMISKAYDFSWTLNSRYEEKRGIEKKNSNRCFTSPTKKNPENFKRLMNRLDSLNLSHGFVVSCLIPRLSLLFS